MDITLNELEEVINYWRTLRPSQGEERALSPEVNSLATIYAMMIYNQQRMLPLDKLGNSSRQLIDGWRRQKS